MGTYVSVSGFRGKEQAEGFLKDFREYHHRRHHQKDRPLHMDALPNGHSGVVSPVEVHKKKGTNIYCVSIALFSIEPPTHAYDTIKDAMEVMTRRDPKMSNIGSSLDITVER